MGNNEVRKLIANEQRWTDKTVPKHKHDYNIEVNVEFAQPRGVFHFHALKCTRCSSFISIPKEGSAIGLIKEPIAGLPTIKLNSTHKTLSFKDAKLIEGCFTNS